MVQLTAVIDCCLKSLRRKRTRYSKHLNGYLAVASTVWTTSDEPTEPHYEESSDLQLDLQSVLEQLSPDDRSVCECLAQGQSVKQIAKVLGCDWHTVRRQIERIREVFEARGLGRWLTNEN